MNESDIYAALKAVYDAIDNDLDRLAAACQDFSQQQQLSTSWTQAQINYVEARNRLFDLNNQEVQSLTTQLKDAQKGLKDSIAELKSIVTTLSKISEAVSIGSSLVGLASPLALVRFGASSVASSDWR